MCARITSNILRRTSSMFNTCMGQILVRTTFVRVKRRDCIWHIHIISLNFALNLPVHDIAKFRRCLTLAIYTYNFAFGSSTIFLCWSLSKKRSLADRHDWKWRMLHGTKNSPHSLIPRHSYLRIHEIITPSGSVTERRDPETNADEGQDHREWALILGASKCFMILLNAIPCV